MRRALISFLVLLSVTGCDERRPLDLDAGSPDGGSRDSGASDGGIVDAGPVDAGSTDAGSPTGVGALSGSCGELDAELASPLSFRFAAALDLPPDFDIETDAARLSEGGQEILRDGTAGGSSVESEAFAYELLFRCDGALLLKTETEIDYTDPSGKKTDFLVSLGGTRIGVSVTRAVGFPRDDPYPVSQATALLEDKLADIADSSANVAAADDWAKQILFVVAYGPMHGESVATAWDALPAASRGDAILYVMVTDGADEFLY
ncbi:MAG: hypothetical protein AB8I08_12520 [Sandaracinaceae bacterium]